ncbi:dynamin family protein-like protein [Bipolaris maydis]|nr:dynamin family protein-like protein [Bipolaris maydis]
MRRRYANHAGAYRPDSVTTSSLHALQSADQRKVMDIVDKLRRTGLSSIVELPSCTSPKVGAAKLKSFSKVMNDFSQLPDVIEEATQAMARPQLTLVDLPGLIHATNKAQTETDKELILNLNDYANQIILDHCRKIDEQGRRTLASSPSLTSSVKHRQRADLDRVGSEQDIYLERGWHMLKNRGLVLCKGRYADLPRECVGIGSLRERLSKDEMVSKLQGTIAEIEKLGDSRNTSHEQRMVLMKISMRISDILNSAIKGYYESSFFGRINMDAAVDAENIRRFEPGHKYTFGDVRAQKELDDLENSVPVAMSFLERFQPMLISQLFWEQSQPWEQIASQHLKPFLTRKAELHKILVDKARHPATYNHYFTTTVQKMRQCKHQEIMKKATEASEVNIYNLDGKLCKHVDPGKLTEAMNKAIELDMDVFSSQEALDTERAFYKDEIKYFVNAITKAVIERHLVAPLPDIILSPLVVTQMTEKEVEFVAAEPPEITQQRLHLESRKSMLEKGLETFREAMGGLKR